MTTMTDIHDIREQATTAGLRRSSGVRTKMRRSVKRAERAAWNSHLADLANAVSDGQPVIEFEAPEHWDGDWNRQWYIENNR